MKGSVLLFVWGGSITWTAMVFGTYTLYVHI